MPNSPFYAKAMRGKTRLVGHWLQLGDASPDRLAMILADTARLAKLGEPDETPDGATLEAWSRDSMPPLWAARAVVFLLVQMPTRPVPHDDCEACAWAYCWLRNRHFERLDEAWQALPEHLQSRLWPALEMAWNDQKELRLI
ncbi:hypothetical protein [Aidingimonas halophila]|uniref:Uncharacterized protein n=1 Tax=Aidingimonas halophila TaxID=574349 RepID=A0A1H2VWH8_9GAMM|nr:hypothetical protein [Aidingimonas halophila]GHC24886.1 hypothetical protein GCM10008094_15090 [Aidingimonas halophila]SDW72606.1 hypothetical protein SAMN05443545_102509 [Aidingimonas halophila]